MVATRRSIFYIQLGLNTASLKHLSVSKSARATFVNPAVLDEYSLVLLCMRHKNTGRYVSIIECHVTTCCGESSMLRERGSSRL